MPFPASWPPRYPSTHRSIRFYVTGTGTADFADNAWIFSELTGANPYTPLPLIAPGSSTVVAVPPIAGSGRNDAGAPAPMIYSNSIRITSLGAVLSFSFDGTNVQGLIRAGEAVIYRNRVEAGIAVSGVGSTFTIEAW